MSRFALSLAWREARGSRRRGLLIVLAVAIGVSALVAINSFTENLRASVRREARALLGADLVIGSAGPLSARTEALVEEARHATTPPAQVARLVTFGAMALAPGGTATRLVQVRGVDPSYPFYGQVATDPPGAWPHLGETGGAIVDGALLAMLGTHVGGEIQLGEARFAIRATILDMPGDVGVASALGPRVFVPRPALDATKLLTFGSRARYEAALHLPPGGDADRIASRLRPALSAERATVRTVSGDQRRLSESLTRFGNFLALVALVALLLGGLGVASAVHVFIRRRMATIAVLRCLGASAGTLLGAYLVQALVVGLAGSVLGAAVGTAVQLLLPRLLADVLPVDVVWSPSWRSMLGGVAVGVWVAVAFALLPILAVRDVPPLAVLRRDYEEARPRRDPVRLLAAVALAASLAALSVIQAGRVTAGLSFALGVAVALALLALAAFLLVRGLRRFFPTFLPYLYRQGLANLYRPANQTFMVVLALGFGVFLLSTLLLVQHNLLRDLRVDRGATRPNLAFFDVQPGERADVEARVRTAGQLTSPVVPIVPMRIATLNGRPASALLAIGDDRQRPERWALRREYRSSYRDVPGDAEKVVAGAWWKPGAWRGRPPGGTEPVPIAIEANLARELRVTLGDEVGWDVQGVMVRSRVAAIRDVQWVRFSPNFFVLFPDGPLEAAPKTFVLLARVEDEALRVRLQREVVAAHPNVSTIDLSQVQRAIESVLDKVVLGVRFMALFSVAAGALVLAGAVAASRQQRVREGALLRTLGATRPQLVRILLAEYVVLGALAAAAALLLSTAAAWGLVHFVFEGSFALPGPSLLGLVLSIVALTILVGLSGSTEVWRRPPLEVLRAE
jgi:putative ABC transport system permease protein